MLSMIGNVTASNHGEQYRSTEDQPNYAVSMNESCHQ